MATFDINAVARRAQYTSTGQSAFNFNFQVNATSELKELHREATVWDNWLILVILILLYSIDVGIRRLIGLS